MQAIQGTIPQDMRGMRLDKALAVLYPQYSRARWQKAIAEEAVLLDELPAEADDRCWGGEAIWAQIDNPHADQHLPQNLPITILDEDEDLLIINKSAGMSVHPGNGLADGTLLNALLFHRPALGQLPRAGIVHRLDKDTTGLMLIAKNEITRLTLIDRIAKRAVSREYLALVKGLLGEVGETMTIDAPIARHPLIRVKMAVHSRGKPARTHCKILRHFPINAKGGYSLVHCQLESGRTHQIRVHLTHMGHSLIGDPLYQNALADPLSLTPLMARQALHACFLSLRHPRTDVPQSWQCSPPEDWLSCLKKLQEHTA